MSRKLSLSSPGIIWNLGGERDDSWGVGGEVATKEEVTTSTFGEGCAQPGLHTWRDNRGAPLGERPWGMPRTLAEGLATAVSILFPTVSLQCPPLVCTEVTTAGWGLPRPRNEGAMRGTVAILIWLRSACQRQKCRG